MRHHIHLFIAAVLFAGGMVCFAYSRVVAGNILVVAAGLISLAGVVALPVHRRAVAVQRDDHR